jgi:hypothetical protein
MSGDEDDRDVPAAASHSLFHLETAHPGEADVDDGAVGVEVVREIGFSGLEKMDFMSVRAERSPHGMANIHVIVNDGRVIFDNPPGM